MIGKELGQVREDNGLRLKLSAVAPANRIKVGFHPPWILAILMSARGPRCAQAPKQPCPATIMGGPVLPSLQTLVSGRVRLPGMKDTCGLSSASQALWRQLRKNVKCTA
jgi:hypothetical protein